MRSFNAVKLVLNNAPKDLTPIQRLVLIQIAHRQPNCFPSIEQLAAEIGVKQPATVTRATKELEARGLIRIERRFKSTNKYVLEVDNLRQTIPLSDVDIRQTIPMSDEPNNTFDEVLYPRATHIKQTINKQDNKEGFFVFLESFPSMTVPVDRVERAWSRALLKDASVEVLIAASRANREKIEPDLWLNLEKWRAYEVEVDELQKLRERSI